MQELRMHQQGSRSCFDNLIPSLGQARAQPLQGQATDRHQNLIAFRDDDGSSRVPKKSEELGIVA